MATLMSFINAIIALPKIMEEIRDAITTVRNVQIDSAYKNELIELRTQITALARAKTNEEIAIAIRNLNNRG